MKGKWPALAVLACLLHACSALAPERVSTLTLPDAWQAEAGAGALRSRWWEGYNDTVLDHLVDEALAHNLDLRRAVARLEEAHATTAAAQGAQWPQAGFGDTANRAKQISDVTLKPYFSSNQGFEVSASYEVDIWGRVQDLVKAAKFGEDAIRQARDSVALSIAASVASAYVNLRAVDDEVALAHRTAISRQSSLKIARARQQTGYGGALESAQAEAELRATTQAIPQLELARERQEETLKVLLGRSGGRIERGLGILELSPQPLPSAGIPSELLRRRPDIASAESLVAAADAQLAAARARLLPSLNLVASWGEVSSSILHGNPFSVWSLGGSVLAPIFNGGELRSLAAASSARRTEALIGYQKVVLDSLAEVETQLTVFQKEQEELRQAELQGMALAENLRIATRRYSEGYSSYLDQLLAERGLFGVQQSVLQLRANTLVAEISVYRALGGGWTGD